MVTYHARYYHALPYRRQGEGLDTCGSHVARANIVMRNGLCRNVWTRRSRD